LGIFDKFGSLLASSIELTCPLCLTFFLALLCPQAKFDISASGSWIRFSGSGPREDDEEVTEGEVCSEG